MPLYYIWGGKIWNQIQAIQLSYVVDKNLKGKILEKEPADVKDVKEGNLFPSDFPASIRLHQF